MRAEALKGHLDAMILAVLEPGPAHGYAVLETLRQRSGGIFTLPTGTIYPALHRLEADGLLASEWSTVAGRRRRTYALTARGLTALADERSDWAEFAEAVAALLTPLEPDHPAPASGEPR